MLQRTTSPARTVDWSRKFFRSDPGAEPQAAHHLARRGALHSSTAPWQTATELLIMIAERGGDPMMARIAMMKALHRRDPQVAMKPRRKRVKAYKIVR
jgi:hypothetical protein